MTVCVVRRERIRAIISDFCFLAFCFISNDSDDKHFCWASCPIIEESQRKQRHCGFLLFLFLYWTSFFPSCSLPAESLHPFQLEHAPPFSSLAAVLQASVVIVIVMHLLFLGKEKKYRTAPSNLFRFQQKSQHCCNCCLTWADTQHLWNLTLLDYFHLLVP